ncbi:hypothetical protein [Fontibacillus sp. BL9]|uniref:hypothetical protein n=1 Tax=Fontibacillus sp. BL9 TaxID=3389971 RepID=UPI00397E18A3
MDKIPAGFHLHPEEASVRVLVAGDLRMGLLTGLIGELRTKPRGPHFAALARSIMSQQISAKAASTICGRGAGTGRGTFPGRTRGGKRCEFAGCRTFGCQGRLPSRFVREGADRGSRSRNTWNRKR